MKIYHGGFLEVTCLKILKPSRTMGAVANDNVYASLNLYEDGFLSKKELLEELMVWKYVDQICFHTEKSLNYLKFIKSEEVFQ